MVARRPRRYMYRQCVGRREVTSRARYHDSRVTTWCGMAFKTPLATAPQLYRQCGARAARGPLSQGWCSKVINVCPSTHAAQSVSRLRRDAAAAHCTGTRFALLACRYTTAWSWSGRTTGRQPSLQLTQISFRFDVLRVLPALPPKDRSRSPPEPLLQPPAYALLLLFPGKVRPGSQLTCKARQRDGLGAGGPARRRGGPPRSRSSQARDPLNDDSVAAPLRTRRLPAGRQCVQS